MHSTAQATYHVAHLEHHWVHATGSSCFGIGRWLNYVLERYVCVPLSPDEENHSAETEQ